MCGAGRMRSDAACIAEICSSREHLQMVEEIFPHFVSSIQFETKYATAVLHLFGGNIILRVGGEKWIFQPGDLFVIFERFGDMECVGDTGAGASCGLLSPVIRSRLTSALRRFVDGINGQLAIDGRGGSYADW